MKNIIKNILIQEAGKGTWREPVYSDSPGMVPPKSYPGSTYNYNTKIYEKFPISKGLFFKAVNLLIKNKSKSWFDDGADLDDSPWYRTSDMASVLKLIGLGTGASVVGLANKLFWAAHDNYDGIMDGAITNYDQLELRALSLYKIPLTENVNKRVTISWSPQVEAYSQEDAYADVLYDDDGMYAYYEWDGDKSYEEDEYDSDSDGKESDGPVDVVQVIYPASKEGQDEQETTEPEPRDTYSSGEEITEAVGPSPEENDIIDDLKEALEIWQTKEYESDKERWGEYHKDIETIVNKYTQEDILEQIELHEIGGYDDPEIGGKHEEFLMKSLLENYLSFRDSMDSLGELLPEIIVQDKLKNELANIANDLVEPMNNYTSLIRNIHGQHTERSKGNDELDESENLIKNILRETISKEEMEDFAEGRGKGAEKITDNAKEKGGNSMLTYHHFKVKLPYYEKATKGKFDKEKAIKEYKKLLEKLYDSTKKEMDIKQIDFQELMGKIEVLGELIVENK